MPVLAAGGIVLRRQQPPLIAVVRLRKRDEWVLPKGKLDQGETPRAAARREVLEETGHNVTVHEFLGTLVCDSGGRSKIVHYWRMEAAAEQAYELMNDVRAVDWLPLEAALARLSRPSEQAFLEHVGPQALAAFARQPKAKATVSRKRRSRPVLMSEPSLAGPVPEVTFAGPRPDVPLLGAISTPMQLEVPSESAAVAERPVPSDDNVGEAKEISFVAELESMATPAEFCRPTPVVPQDGGDDASVAAERRGRSLAQKVRDWLGRAA